MQQRLSKAAQRTQQRGCCPLRCALQGFALVLEPAEATSAAVQGRLCQRPIVQSKPDCCYQMVQSPLTGPAVQRLCQRPCAKLKPDGCCQEMQLDCAVVQCPLMAAAVQMRTDCCYQVVQCLLIAAVAANPCRGQTLVAVCWRLIDPAAAPEAADQGCQLLLKLPACQTPHCLQRVCCESDHAQLRRQLWGQLLTQGLMV